MSNTVANEDTMPDPSHRAKSIFDKYLSARYPDHSLARKLGMIGKSMLVDGGCYSGYTPAGRVAHWDAKEEKFIIRVFRNGSSRFERICHPEDSNGLDVFCPVKLLTRLHNGR